MTDTTTFLPGPNLRVARNDSGMSQAAQAGLPSGCILLNIGGSPVWRAPDGTDYPFEGFHTPIITDKVDPLNSSTYTEDIHTRSDGSKERVLRAKPAPLPENATLQDRLRRYSPVNGYARYCAMAADKIDEQEKQLQACRNLQMELNNQLKTARIEIENLQHSERTLLRSVDALNRLYLQSTEDCQKQAQRAINANARLFKIDRRGFWARLYHAFKGEKA